MTSFLDVLQDIKDRQRIVDAAKNGGLFGALDAHQKMRERQQLRDLATAAQESVELQRKQLELQSRARQSAPSASPSSFSYSDSRISRCRSVDPEVIIDLLEELAGQLQDAKGEAGKAGLDTVGASKAAWEAWKSEFCAKWAADRSQLSVKEKQLTALESQWSKPQGIRRQIGALRSECVSLRAKLDKICANNLDDYWGGFNDYTFRTNPEICAHYGFTSRVWAARSVYACNYIFEEVARGMASTRSKAVGKGIEGRLDALFEGVRGVIEGRRSTVATATFAPAASPSSPAAGSATPFHARPNAHKTAVPSARDMRCPLCGGAIYTKVPKCIHCDCKFVWEDDSRDSVKNRDALPKCPECHSPIDGNQPRRCATCRSELYWLRGKPLARGDAMSLASSGWSLPELERCRDQLTKAAIELAAALCLVRDAGISDVSGCKDAAAKRIKRVQSLEQQAANLSGMAEAEWELTDPLSRQHDDLEKEISAVRSRIAEIKERQSHLELDFNSGAPALRAQLKQSLKVAMDKVPGLSAQLAEVKKKVREARKHREVKVAAERQRLFKQIEDVKHFAPRLADLQAVCDQAKNAESAVASVAKALELIEPLRRSLGGDAASMPSILEINPNDEAPLQLGMPDSGEVEIEVRLPSDTVAHRMTLGDFRQWIRDTATGVEVARATGARDWVSVRKALPALFVPLLERARIERLLRSGIAIQPGDETPLTEDAVVDLLLPGMCAVAAADGVLQSTERSLIVELMYEKGCSEDRAVLEAKVVDTCRRIRKDGLRGAVEELCQRLKPFVGRPMCDLFLELLQRIAAADGRIGSRESAILDLFKQHLIVS